AACTATLNTSFGSKVLVPGTGILLNNQMDDFSIKPGVPNAFGLVGAEANAIAPGKRPLSSMSPTIVLKDGRPILTVGAAGGPTIITQALLTIIRTIDLDQPLPEAVKAPRFHHQWKPDQVSVEKSLDPQVIAGLETRGHILNPLASFGTCQAIALDPATLTFTAVSEPRGSGAAGCVSPTPQ
ncbi:MAG: gamma-glutamyltransferase, partial [Akkermansiaceae bacterium]|nr:gamma-glutamyltransferase [Akkermansiaceae bacterium]